MPLGQLIFNGRLSHEQPIHRRIERVLIGNGDRKPFAQGAKARPSPSPRAVASFERGSMRRATIIATARLRSWLGLGAITPSRPSFRRLPSTEATCPWGLERTTTKASSLCSTAVPPRNRDAQALHELCRPLGEIGEVRLRIFLPSRQPSRTRMAGGEFRLGTTSMYMGTFYAIHSTTASIVSHTYMGT